MFGGGTEPADIIHQWEIRPDGGKHFIRPASRPAGRPARKRVRQMVATWKVVPPPTKTSTNNKKARTQHTHTQNTTNNYNQTNKCIVQKNGNLYREKFTFKNQIFVIFGAIKIVIILKDKIK